MKSKIDELLKCSMEQTRILSALAQELEDAYDDELDEVFGDGDARQKELAYLVNEMIDLIEENYLLFRTPQGKSIPTIRKNSDRLMDISLSFRGNGK